MAFQNIARSRIPTATQDSYFRYFTSSMCGALGPRCGALKPGALEPWGARTLGRSNRNSLGYSFLGNEPDSVVCCDLDDCQLPMQSLDYKRLNCGHSFHLSCLRDREHGQNRSNQVDPTRLCPICHPLLEARIRELSTTMNRLVPNQIMLSLNDS